MIGRLGKRTWAERLLFVTLTPKHRSPFGVSYRDNLDIVFVHSEDNVGREPPKCRLAEVCSQELKPIGSKSNQPYRMIQFIKETSRCTETP